MNDRLLDYAIRIQSIAQAGLQYGKDKYDRERYAELREIAAEMISAKTDISMEKVRDLFCNETGYQTPKIDTRAAVFIDGKILLVHENNGTWCLPGGWCDVDQSIASNTEKEVRRKVRGQGESGGLRPAGGPGGDGLPGPGGKAHCRSGLAEAQRRELRLRGRKVLCAVQIRKRRISEKY